MDIDNYTPFIPLLFLSQDLREREFWTLVLRATFRISPDSPLIPIQHQSPILEADLYHGDPSSSSLYFESDLAPFKPGTDVYLNAIAHAPEGRATAGWNVEIQAERIRKTLRVTGPRNWQRTAGRYQLSPPEPCLEVPLRYELAYGGCAAGVDGRLEAYQENPVGLGFVVEGAELPGGPIPAPQIEAPEDPIGELGKPHTPQGFGPLSRAWMSRRRLAGTFDHRWRQERCPALPADFDDAFYNCAPAELICPGYLAGDETVSLSGLAPQGLLRFQLPGYRLAVLMVQDCLLTSIRPLLLDTLAIDVVQGQAYLTWRTVFREPPTLRLLEIRMQRGGRRGTHE